MKRIREILKQIFSFKGILLILLILLVFYLASIYSTLESISSTIGTEGVRFSRGTGLIGAIESVSKAIGSPESDIYQAGDATGLCKVISELGRWRP